MEKLIDSRFERLEKALASLIDSISKYTPSSNQAGDLVAADRDLGDGLDLLQRHQDNYVRVQRLRRETADLDAQIKSTISVLWDTRREVTGTPTTAFYPPASSSSGSSAYSFTYSELLDYARRISRTTLPPPGVTNGVDLTAPPPAATTLSFSSAQNGEASAAQTPAGGVAASGAATPVPGVDGTATTGTTATTSLSQPPPLGGAGAGDQGPALAHRVVSTTSTSATALPEHMRPAVNLLDGAVFYPWPGEERIRSGALALNQQLRESGVEPRGYDPEEEERRRQAAEQERKEAEERQRRQHEEQDRRMREERERIARERAEARAREDAEAYRRGSVVIGGGAPSAAATAAAPASATASGEKKQFQFMGDLDDDDDDDDD